MKVGIYLRLSEALNDGYGFTTVYGISSWIAEDDNHRFVGEVDVDINEHVEWLASKGLEMAEAMEAKARLELARKLSAAADYKAKFLSLTHEASDETQS